MRDVHRHAAENMRECVTCIVTQLKICVTCIVTQLLKICVNA